MMPIALPDLLKFASTLVKVFPVAWWKFGAGDFNDNGTPDVIFEVKLKMMPEPLVVVVDVPAADVKNAFAALADVLGG
jgi:hypothetical protein